ASDGRAAASNDEQHPPARSKARRERSEWINELSPLFGPVCSGNHVRTRAFTATFPYPYGSASILVLQTQAAVKRHETYWGPLWIPGQQVRDRSIRETVRGQHPTAGGRRVRLGT